MRVNVIDTGGKPSGTIVLPDEMFAVKAHPLLTAWALCASLSNRRRARAKTKTRGMVEGSGRKIWRQKGTGRARHGDRYAPIFVGGGVAHGPTGTQSFTHTVPKRMRRRALYAALSEKLRDKQLMVVEGMERLEPKTKRLAEVLKLLTKGPMQQVSLVLSDSERDIMRSARNIGNLTLFEARKLNAYEVMSSGVILLTKKATGTLMETFLGRKRQVSASFPAAKHQSGKQKQKRTIKTGSKTTGGPA